MRWDGILLPLITLLCSVLNPPFSMPAQAVAVDHGYLLPVIALVEMKIAVLKEGMRAVCYEAPYQCGKDSEAV